MFDLNTYTDVHIIIQPTKHLLLIILIRQMSTRMKLRGLGGDVMKHWTSWEVKTQLTYFILNKSLTFSMSQFLVFYNEWIEPECEMFL